MRCANISSTLLIPPATAPHVEAILALPAPPIIFEKVSQKLSVIFESSPLLRVSVPIINLEV